MVLNSNNVQQNIWLFTKLLCSSDTLHCSTKQQNLHTIPKCCTKKNHIKFIYHFVKYNNKSSNLYEFQCYIGGHLFPVTCWFQVYGIYIYSHFRIMAHNIILFLSSSHQERHLLSRERPAPSCRLPTPWSVKEHYFNFILKSASNHKFLYTSFIYFQI